MIRDAWRPLPVLLFVWLQWTAGSGQPRELPAYPASLRRQLLDIAAEPGWSWPADSFLRLGSDEDVYTTATVRAGERYSSLSIHIPSHPCAVRTTLGRQYTPAVHFYNALQIDVLIHLDLPGNVGIFLGSSLSDGYKIDLGNALKSTDSSLVKVTNGLVVGEPLMQASLLTAAAGGSDIWVSYRLLSGTATLRVGPGSIFDAGSPVHYLVDPSPPQAIFDAVHVWVASFNNSVAVWQVCPAGSARDTISSAFHPAPKLKLVRQTATSGDCSDNSQDAPPPSQGNWPLQLTVQENRLVYRGSGFGFMHGGRYGFCYGANANNICRCSAGSCICTVSGLACNASIDNLEGSCNPFVGKSGSARPRLLFADVLVFGISSSCTTPGCLSSERWDCYFQELKQPGGLCTFDFSPGTGRVGWAITPTMNAGSRISWSAAFGQDLLFAGIFNSAQPRACGMEEPPATEFDVPAHNASFPILPDVLAAPSLPAVRASVDQPFTVALCYCPATASKPCSSRQHYIQQFGVLYQWLVNVCDGRDPVTCKIPYLRILPLQRFVTKILCPPGGACASSNENRIKFLPSRNEESAKTNWGGNNLCQRYDTEPGSVLWPFETDSLNLDGGPRADYKLWAAKQVQIRLSTQSYFHVCYCNGECNRLQNWIQVGRVTSITAFAFASSTPGVSGGAAPKQTVAYVNKAGSFTLYGGIKTPRPEEFPSPYDSSTYLGDVLLYFQSFDNEAPLDGLTLAERVNVKESGVSGLQDRMNLECRYQLFSPTLVEGLASASDARLRISSSSAPSNYAAFAGRNQDQEIRVLKAGTLAVCYCGSVTPQGVCLSGERWMFAGLLQIRGPRSGQTWLLPTRVLVAIHDAQGWGFERSDKLRLISKDASCTSADARGNSFSPMGSNTFLIGCPSGSNSSTSCQQADAEHLITVKLADSIRTGISITALRIESEARSVLTFDGRITDHMATGDAIMLDPQAIVINGKDVAAMSEVHKFDAFSLAGLGQFQDQPSKTFLRHPHHVSFLEGWEDGTVQRSLGQHPANKLRIPIGWSSSRPEGVPKFSFTNVSRRAQWFRSSTLSTEEELRAHRTVTGLPLCWAPLDGSSNKFYGTAGTVTFADPDPLGGAKLILTCRLSGAKAPVLVTFSPSQTVQVYPTLMGEMTLTLRFLNTGKLSPARATGPKIDAGDSLPAKDMTQAACGELFLELWSDSSEGFPVPKACYFTEEGAAGQAAERELTMVFERFNGLRSYCGSSRECIYQVVFNAVVIDLLYNPAINEVSLELDIGCRFESGGCNTRYQILERGQVLLADTSGTGRAAGTLPQGVSGAAAKFDPNRGFEFAGLADGGVHELTPSAMNISVQLRASGEPGIQPGAILRIFLAPLTQWNLNAGACDASCTPSPGTACGTLLCTAHELVPNVEDSLAAHFATMKLTLPTGMDAITGRTVHTFTITGLSAPVANLFPMPISAELTSSADRDPDYASTKGFLAMLGHASSLWLGRLVQTGREGSGPKPFVGQRNLLYAQIRFPASVWTHFNASGQATGAEEASLELKPPPGFVCSVEGSGLAPHSYDFEPGVSMPSQIKVDRRTDAPFDGEIETLLLLDRNLDYFGDHTRGRLSVGDADGSWQESAGRSSCRYMFKPRQKIHAGQVVLIPLQVLNPSSPFSRTDPSNKWSALFSCSGWSHSVGSISFDFEQTEAAAGKYADLWVDNTSVLAAIEDSLLQPERLTFGSEQFLSVFFKTVQSTGGGGRIIVDAPVNFSFGSSCIVEDFKQTVYDATDAPGNLRPLPLRASCSGNQTPEQKGLGVSMNRAVIEVGGNLRAGRMYGFRIKVKNAEALESHFAQSFHIWTADARGFPLDGSEKPVSFASKQGTSWPLYAETWSRAPTLYIESGFLRPHQAFWTTEVLVVDSLVVPGTGSVVTSLRISAPRGCEFVGPSMGGFLPPLVLSLGQGAASSPLWQDPLLTSPNQLAWESITLQTGVHYGFRCLFKVSLASSGLSAQFFVLELGYNSTVGPSIGALSVQSPPVRILGTAPLGYSSSLAGDQDNTLTFYFRTVSRLEAVFGNAIMILGGEALKGMHLLCPVVSRLRPATPGFEDTVSLPAGSLCSVTSLASSGAPLLMIRPGVEAIPAGSYALEVKATNPTTGIGLIASWTIGCYQNVTQDAMDGGTPIDAPASALGFRLRSPMLASLPNLPGTERRPLHVAMVVLSFQLPAASRPRASLMVRMPAGFAIQEDCLSSISTTPAVQGNYTAWTSTPQECFGLNSAASLLIPGALAAGHYAFSLQVKNPEAHPLSNHWIIEFDTFASKPLDGYPLALLSFPVPLEPTSQTPTMQSFFTPLGISFKLHQALPHLGSLDIFAPEGFELSNVTGLQQLTTQAETSTQNAAISTELALASTGKVATIIIKDAGGLLAGVTYKLYIMVKNPGTLQQGLLPHWKMSSFDSTRLPLDEGAVESFKLHPLAAFSVINLKGQRHSNQRVQFEVVVSFPEDIRFNDVLTFRAPSGYSLLDTKPPLCNSFSWTRWDSVVLAPVPKCSCYRGPCELLMRFESEGWKQERETKGIAYAKRQSLSFTLETENPFSSPKIENSYWSVAHMRPHATGVTAFSTESSAVFPGWDIAPKLEGATVELIGSSQAAGFVSDLLLRFVPSRSATTAVLTAEFPYDVSFSAATLQAPRLKGAGTAGPILVITGLLLLPDVQASITIAGVRLGKGGGQSIFTLRTHLDEDSKTVLDESLSFAGFFQAGVVTVEGHLKSRYSENPTTYPVLNTLPARVGEEGKITFRLTFSFPVLVGDIFLLTCQGSGAYTLLADQRLSLALVSYDGLGTGTVLNIQKSLRGNHAIEIHFLHQTTGDTSNTTVLESAQRVELVFWAVPTAGLTTWRADTYRGSRLTNSNDGSASGFRPVTQLKLLLAPIRSPPGTFITVNMQLSSEEALIIPEIQLLAPRGFAFDAVCGELCSSLGETFMDTGRQIAKFAHQTGSNLMNERIDFQCKTPMQTPQTLTWIVRASSTAGQNIGWGLTDGFKVNQMQNAQVLYGGVASLTNAELAFSFTFETVPDDDMFSIIEVGAPSSIILSCSGTDLRSLSLPGKQTCDRDGPGQVRVLLDETLRPNTYAFTVSGRLPAETPEPNLFSIIVRQQSNEQIVDAAFGLAGWPSGSISSTQPTLAWTTAGYGKISLITIAFSIGNATSALQALLISLPPGFSQSIGSSRDVLLSNQRLPLVKGANDWLDASERHKVRIHLDPQDPKVDVGIYLFTFPFTMPESSSYIDPVNLWHLSMCATRSCSRPSDASVLLSFPMGGFRPGEQSSVEALRVKTAKEAAGLSDIDSGTCASLALQFWLCSLAWLVTAVASS
eukprot:TRINITY_DN102575_c0_g1_i1.p1 TRINITY_DN102575_c0_g1~~TRINITY_DN102575_c0_g1_i1.p1  ORF type:complete len:3349 (+),score=445.13 TRINITY_DN102575_c0_g1_i1:84-10130(+)